jgi:hypothetical protein
MSLRSWLWACAVLGTIGCSSPLDNNEVLALAQARQRWASRGFDDYTFETRHGCFCPPEITGPVRITVRQGTILSVTLLETGALLPPADLVHWYTIEQLFARIPATAQQDGVADVGVVYDQALGYPASIRVTPDEGILDAGESYSVSAVGPAE